MTKLDETFVAFALKKHPDAAHYINALAEEVRRLELLGARYEAALEEIARKALHLIDPEELKRRLGPGVAEQIEAAQK
jgi:hypothetical protein